MKPTTPSAEKSSLDNDMTASRPEQSSDAQNVSAEALAAQKVILAKFNERLKQGVGLRYVKIELTDEFNGVAAIVDSYFAARLRQSQQAAPSAWIKKGDKPLTFPAYFWQDDCKDGNPLWLCTRASYCETVMTYFMPITLPAPPIPELTAEEKQIQEDKAAWETFKENSGWSEGKYQGLHSVFLAGRQSQRSQGGKST